MPTPPRAARVLLALALVVGVVAASGPAATLGVDGSGSVSWSHARRAAPEPVLSRADPATVGAPETDHRLTRGRLVSARRAPVLESPGDAVVPGQIDWISRSRPDVPEPRAKSISTATTARSADPASFKGRNHVWIPALGIDRSISFYACSSSGYPGNRVYRWGCAGSNNVYLFGHAYSVFKPLHDAYVRGRLSKAMKVYYANGDGVVGTYAVAWWKVTTPDNGTWAYAAQSKPSLTLQTCVGARSQYRLIVRLTKVG